MAVVMRSGVSFLRKCSEGKVEFIRSHKRSRMQWSFDQERIAEESCKGTNVKRDLD